jgi:hypothetical protein
LEEGLFGIFSLILIEFLLSSNFLSEQILDFLGQKQIVFFAKRVDFAFRRRTDNRELGLGESFLILIELFEFSEFIHEIPLIEHVSTSEAFAE